MKISCNKHSLVNAMKIVLKAIPKRTATPILECVLIDARDGEIHLMSNDLEVAIDTDLDGSIIEPGAIAVDASMLNNIAGKLPNDSVMISVNEDETSVTVKAGKSKFQIPCKDPDDFIRMPEIEDGVRFSLSGDDFKSLITGTAFCSDQTEKNAMMSGCKFDIDGNELTVCALDGHRIAIRKCVLDEAVEKTEVVAKARILLEVSRIVPDGCAVYVTITKANMIFDFEGTIVLVRLIAGDYFNFKKIFESEPTTTVKLDRNEFSDCLNRSTVLLRESEKKPLILDISDQTIRFLAQSNLGVANEELEVNKTGNDLRVGYNPRFLLDAVNAVGQDGIEIRMCGSRGPAIITEDGADYSYVVLPVNI